MWYGVGKGRGLYDNVLVCEMKRIRRVGGVILVLGLKRKEILINIGGGKRDMREVEIEESCMYFREDIYWKIYELFIVIMILVK